MVLGKLRAIHDRLNSSTLSARIVGPNVVVDEGEVERKDEKIEFGVWEREGGTISSSGWKGIFNVQSYLHSGHSADLIVSHGSIVASR